MRLGLFATFLLLLVLLVDRASEQLLTLPHRPSPGSAPPGLRSVIPGQRLSTFKPVRSPLALVRERATTHPDDAAAWLALARAVLDPHAGAELQEALEACQRGAAVAVPSPAREVARRDAALLALACGQRGRGLADLAAAARAQDRAALRFLAIIQVIDGDPDGGATLARACAQLPEDLALRALALPPRRWLGLAAGSPSCPDPWAALACARAWAAAGDDARAAASLATAGAFAAPLADPVERLLPFTRAQLGHDAVLAQAGPSLRAALARWPTRLPGEVAVPAFIRQ